MKLSFTGHRPQHLYGYDFSHPSYSKLINKIKEQLIELNPKLCYSGMALGVDQIAVQACIDLNMPYIACIPFIGQESLWRKEAQEQYFKLLEKAKEKVIVCEGAYSPIKMQIRNEYMVNNCDILLAVWNGNRGGTGNCVKYAEQQNKQIIIINPKNI